VDLAGVDLDAEQGLFVAEFAEDVAAGADGVHIEVHNCPEQAMSDGPQALLPEQYAELAKQIRAIAEVLGKKISPLPSAA